jgi:hypothetical protein
MRRVLGLALFAACPAMATEVVDTFETDANPNGWIWINDLGQVVGSVQPSGGNPGGWFDSEDLYFKPHPEVVGTAPAGSELRAALASGTLLTASIDFQRLDTSAENNCHPIYDLPSHFSIRFFDQHTVPTTPRTTIAAYTTGEVSPLQGPFPWMTVTFTIPSAATEVPAGWVLAAPPDIDYTWQDMMHNIDGIAFGVVDPEDITYSSCWHLGVDNIMLTYGDAGEVFENGFEGTN